MKKVILSLVCVGLFSSLSAEGMGVVAALTDVAKTKIKEDAYARAPKSEVKIDNSQIHATAEKGNDNVVLGTDGSVVAALADIAKTKIKEDAHTDRAKKSDVKIDNSEIHATAEQGNDNFVVGIDGSVVAVGEQVEISNSEISAEGMGVVTALEDFAIMIEEDAHTARADKFEVKIDNSQIHATAENGNDNFVVGVTGATVLGAK